MQDNSSSMQLAEKIKDACNRNDISRLIDILQNLSPSLPDNFVVRLLALELQIRLVDVYVLGLKRLYSIEQMKQESLPASKEDKLNYASQIRAAIEDFLRSFEEAIQPCFNTISDPSLPPISTVDKLRDQPLAPSVVKLLAADVYREQDWLINRAYATKLGVEEGLWASLNSIETYLSDERPEKNDLTEFDNLKGDVFGGVNTAIRELEMAAQGLLPGALERLEHGH